MSEYRLYSFWRSSASWRVRIGLNLKGVDYHLVPLNITSGVQREDEHSARNPMRQVPTLEFESDGRRVALSQSIAILEMLEELHPEPSFFPSGTYLRARARELAEGVNAGIQPHQNTATIARMDALRAGLGAENARHYIEVGLAALERRARETAGRFLVGDSPSLADICVVPQLTSSRRFGIPVESLFPTLVRAETSSLDLPAFQAAHPDRQPDANSA